MGGKKGAKVDPSHTSRSSDKEERKSKIQGSSKEMSKGIIKET